MVGLHLMVCLEIREEEKRFGIKIWKKIKKSVKGLFFRDFSEKLNNFFGLFQVWENKNILKLKNTFPISKIIFTTKLKFSD